VDESETGSANFFGPKQVRPTRDRRPVERVTIASVHLRPPSIDRGVTSFLWALGLALFIWLGLLAVGVSSGTALMLGLLSFGAIFLYVRTQGGDV
jgi:hypothetical protein